MVTTLAISKYVNSLLEVETKFSAQQAISDRFFRECYEDLPELMELEKERCDRLKERYLYHRHHGHISQGYFILKKCINDFSVKKNGMGEKPP